MSKNEKTFSEQVQRECDEILADASALVDSEELYKSDEAESRVEKLFNKIFKF